MLNKRCMLEMKDIQRMFSAVGGTDLTLEDGWFLTFLTKLKELEEKGFRATDIYIQENKPIAVGILKNFVPVNFVKTELVTQTSIRKIIRKLYSKRLMMVGYTDAEASRITEEMIKSENFKSFSIAIYGLGILRITYSKSQSGDVMAVRILPFEVPRLEEVYIPPMYKEFLFNLLQENRITLPWDNDSKTLKSIRRGGLIIHSGPTGSGKSTSIAAQIHEIAIQSAGVVITYEDPVEYRYITSPNVIQYEIGIDIDPEEIYHHFLRSTAQVAVFGETRTKEQFLQVIDIASRGHLVYTTLHANSVVEALMMMKEFAGRENLALLTNSLLAISYQRLVLDSNTGKIKTLYEQLMFKEDIPEIKQIKQMIEKEETPQMIKNFFIDNGKRLSDLRVYNNYANVVYL